MRRALLLLTLLAATSASAEKYYKGTPVALWLEPAAPIWAGLSSAVVYVPVGFSVGVGSSVSLQLEAAPIWKPSDGLRSALGGIGSLGLAWHLLDRPAQSGPFVVFKVTGGYLKHEGPAPRTGYDDPVPGEQIEVGGGIDFGWQFRFGALYVAPLLGLGGVYRMKSSQSAVLFPVDTAVHGPTKRGDGVDFGFNLNLLRFGVIF